MNFVLSELPLKLSGVLLVKLRRVLFYPQSTGQVLLIEEAVVVGLQVFPVYFLERARATMSWTDSANGDRLETATGVTLEDSVVIRDEAESPPVRIRPPSVVHRYQ